MKKISPGKPEKMKLLVYGDPGAGKTYFSSTFPNPVFIDLEGGLTGAAQEVLAVNERYPNSLEDLFDMIFQAEEYLEEHPGTLVVDSFQEIINLVEQDIFSSYDHKRAYEGVLNQGDYRKLFVDTMKIVRHLLNGNYNLVITGIALPVSYQGEKRYPKFTGRMLGPEIFRLMDNIAYCYSDGAGDNWVSFVDTESWLAKTRFAELRKELEWPNNLKEIPPCVYLFD